MDKFLKIIILLSMVWRSCVIKKKNQPQLGAKIWPVNKGENCKTAFLI